MDIGIFIIVMIVMYVVPEILKRVKPKKPYQYPEFPSTLPSDGRGTGGMPGELSRGMKPPPLQDMTGEGMPGDEGDPAWRLRMELTLPEVKGLAVEPGESFRAGTSEAALGFVWAELIAPPVALRQTRRGLRRF